jgi:hypothetical protein
MRDIPSEDRRIRPYHHVDPGFINYRLCSSVFGNPLVKYFDQHRKPGNDQWNILYNHHLFVDLVLTHCKELKVKTLGEVLQGPKEGELFCSTEELEGTDDVYEKKRVRNRVLLPYEFEKSIYLEFGTEHFVADTGMSEQSDKNKVSIIGRIRRVGEEVVIYPLIMGAPSFVHPLNEELNINVDLAWYGMGGVGMKSFLRT